MKFFRWLGSLPWSWILGLGTLAGAFLIWRSKKNDIDTLKAALEVQKLREHVARDKAIVDELLLEADKHADAIAVARGDIRNAQERAIWLGSPAGYNELKGMSDADVARSFTELGF
jgi:hypothetical protein